MKKLNINTIFNLITVIIAILIFIFVSEPIITQTDKNERTYLVPQEKKYIYAPIAEVPTICIIR